MLGPTEEKLKTAPSIIKQIWARMMKYGYVPSTLYTVAMDLHPEFFPEEVDLKNKLDAVPQDVRDAWLDEYAKLRDQFFGNEGPQEEKNGFMYYVHNPEELKKWNDNWSQQYELFRIEEEKLNKKYFSNYGL